MASSQSSHSADNALRRVVNAAGKMTYLGSSVCSPTVVAALGEGARRWVEMRELGEVAGRRVARACGAEAGLVVSCAAAGLSIAAAACLTGTDQRLIEAVPVLPADVPRRIVLQKGHAVHFGAPLTTMLRMGGALVEEVGSANRCSRDLFARALVAGTRASVFVVSHHAGEGELLDLASVIELSHAAGVPVIVDAAAETDLKRYVAMGADLVVYSGHKAIGGPTSGLIAGSRDLIAACAAQGTGIARAMKIGKESVFGLMAALDEYESPVTDHTSAAQHDVAVRIVEALNGIRGISSRVAKDATRPISRARVHVDAALAGLSAVDLVARLEHGSPSIRCRAHHAADGHFDLDPRTLSLDEADIVSATIRSLVEQTASDEPPARS